MDKPQPRRDKDGVPWCSCHCRRFRNVRGTWCTLQHPDTKVKENAPCLPALREDYKRMREMERVVSGLYAGLVWCENKAWNDEESHFVLDVCAKLKTLRMIAESALPKENSDETETA